MYGYVYKTTNLLNNKIYVGKHKVFNDKFDTNYYGSGKLINRAINKYGIENFKVELLEWCYTLEKLDERERYQIELLKARDPNIGYNLQFGGEGGWEYVNTYQKGEKHPWYGRHHSEETKQKISSHINFKGENNPFYGKHHSDKSKEKLSNNAKINPNYGMKNKKVSDNTKKLISEAALSRWSNEEEKEKQSKRVKNAWQNEEYRKKHCEAMRGVKKNITYKECPYCSRSINACNYTRHIETHLDGRYEENMKHYHLDHDDLFCKFCKKECFNRRSLSAHERRCKYRTKIQFQSLSQSS